MGEILLLGSVIIYAELMTLSLAGLYRAPFMWGLVLLNLFAVILSPVQQRLIEFFSTKITLDMSLMVFILMLGVFVFRNCFFLYDVDSHSTYLFAQKLWLSGGTSLIGDRASDLRIFSPQFDAVPYGLGLSIFPKETLFPQLINLFWRIVCLLLVFGYTSYRFNRFYGLAASLLVLFNDHFYYSGANNSVVLNGAVIAFIFCAAYSFWEGRVERSHSRFFLGLIFISQLMNNKYQIAYAFMFLFIFGLLIQKKPLEKIKQVLWDKKKSVLLLIFGIIALLIYLKNWIVTGLPAYPVLAGKYKVLNWHPEMARVFFNYARGVTFQQFVKYMNYLFIWPGINAAKYVILTISFMPLLILVSLLKENLVKENLMELCYWLGMSIFLIMGICLACHQDPRYYRFAIAVLAFSSILSFNFIFTNCFGIKNKWIIGWVIFMLSITGWKIIMAEKGSLLRPSFKDNIDVIMNKVHTQDFMSTYFPENVIVNQELEKSEDKVLRSAWDKGNAGRTKLSAFFLPIRPQVGMWLTTVVSWDSYKDEDRIIKDLEDYGIDWIMRVEHGKLIFISKEDYAKEAVHYEKYPRTIMYDYNFPKELKQVVY